jgi:hypothetical protein
LPVPVPFHQWIQEEIKAVYNKCFERKLIKRSSKNNRGPCLPSTELNKRLANRKEVRL